MWTKGRRRKADRLKDKERIRGREREKTTNKEKTWKNKEIKWEIRSKKIFFIFINFFLLLDLYSVEYIYFNLLFFPVVFFFFACVIILWSCFAESESSGWSDLSKNDRKVWYVLSVFQCPCLFQLNHCCWITTLYKWRLRQNSVRASLPEMIQGWNYISLWALIDVHKLVVISICM